MQLHWLERAFEILQRINVKTLDDLGLKYLFEGQE